MEDQKTIGDLIAEGKARAELLARVRAERNAPFYDMMLGLVDTAVWDYIHMGCNVPEPFVEPWTAIFNIAIPDFAIVQFLVRYTMCADKRIKAKLLNWNEWRGDKFKRPGYWKVVDRVHGSLADAVYAAERIGALAKKAELKLISDVVGKTTANLWNEPPAKY